MWNQIRDANWRIPYIGGWCEGYVEGAWGEAGLPKQDKNGNWFTSGMWASAMAKWNTNPGNGNHPGELPPAGKTVPVYFSLGNVPEGHTAISLDDGKVASSTQAGNPSQAGHAQGYIHPNLQDLINVYAKYNGGCTYLGWSEYVGNIQVVKNNTQNITLDDLNIMYRDILERPKQPNGNYADDGAITHYVGNFTNDFVRNDLLTSNEYKLLQSRKAIDAAQAIADKQASDAAQAAAVKAATDKAIQDAKDAQTLKDAQAADEKARQEAAAKAAADVLAATQPKKDSLLSILINSLVNLFNLIFKRSK